MPFTIFCGIWIAIIIALQFFVGWESALLLSVAVMLVALAIFLVFEFFKGPVKNDLMIGLAIWAALLAVALATMALKQCQP